MATTYTQEEWLALTSLLMDDFSVRLRKEFELGRIVGTDYANAYISNVNAATSQAQAFLLSKDTAGANADTAREQANQAIITTEIMTATKQDSIDTSAEQLEQLNVQGQIQDEQLSQALVQGSIQEEQLEQALVQGNILDQQETQATHQTTILANNADVSTATKQNTIDTSAEQLDQLTVQGKIQDEQLAQTLVQGNILDQQEIQATYQTTVLSNNAEVSTATKQDNIDLAAAQTDIAEEQVNTQINQTDSVLAQTEVMRERGGFR